MSHRSVAVIVIVLAAIIAGTVLFVTSSPSGNQQPKAELSGSVSTQPETGNMSKQPNSEVGQQGGTSDDILSAEQATQIARREVSIVMSKVSIPKDAKVDTQLIENMTYRVTFLSPQLHEKNVVVTGNDYYAIVTVDAKTGKAVVQGPP